MAKNGFMRYGGRAPGQQAMIGLLIADAVVAMIRLVPPQLLLPPGWQLPPTLLIGCWGCWGKPARQWSMASSDAAPAGHPLPASCW